MRLDDVWITGTGRVHGELTPTWSALADGRYDQRSLDKSGMVSVSECDLSPPELAVAAGKYALDAAGPGSPKPGLHLFGSFTFPGLDYWAASCWVARQLLGDSVGGLSLTVSAMCNTSLASLELAACMLVARPDLATALLTVADRFPAEAVDRWRFDPGVLLGDGAAAAVVGRGGGLLRVLSVASHTDATLEGLQRGREPFRPRSHEDGQPVVLGQRSADFFLSGERTQKSVVLAHIDGVRRVARQALADAGCTIEDARWVVAPFVGRTAFHYGYEAPLRLAAKDTLLDVGLTLGHLGGADHLYAVDHLLREGLLASGDVVVLIGVGGGFSFSCAVLKAP